jgi:hypothetical protein
MHIKNLLRAISFMIMIAITSPAIASYRIIDKPSADSVSKADSIMAQQILQRVAEIQSMDKSNLSPAEKAALRKELKTMRDDAEHSHGVYISIGAAIIIILLLILILR